MKIQNIFRTSTIAVGIAAAALFLASSVHAQEIVNSEFSDGPNVTSFQQPTTGAQVSAESTAADANTAVPPTVAISTPVVTEEALVSLGKSAERWLIGSSLFGLAMLALYAIAEIRRANHEMDIQARTPLARGVALY
jgi:hypothetical protein